MSRRGWCVCLVGGWGRCWSRTGAWRTKPLDIDEAIQSFFRPWMLRARGVEARASKTGWGRRGWSSPPTGEEAVMLDPLAVALTLHNRDGSRALRVEQHKQALCCHETG